MGQICTDDQIRELEEKCGVVLPVKYKEFLKNGDALFEERLIGSDIKPPHLENLNEWASELLEDNGTPYELKADDFVFCMHQGYMFNFINCSEDVNDPPVYYYCEGESNIKKVSPSFTTYIASVINYVEQ